MVVDREEISNEHLVAIGKLVVAFTQLEEMVSVCFSLVLGCKPELGGIITNGCNK